MTSSNSIGNIMTRLGGIKNVRPRRVMPGAEFLQDLEEPETDVTGTAPRLPNFANLAPRGENLPEADLGTELTPQSYDVRANVELPQQQEEAGFFSRLGQALADYISPSKREEMNKANQEMFSSNQARMEAPSITEPTQEPAPQAPPIATEQVDIQEGLPPVTPTEEMAPAPNIPETTAEIPAPLPEVEKEIPVPEAKEPGTYVELGAAQQVYNDPNASPELKAEIERIFDTKLTPERSKEVNEFEKVVDAFLNKLEGVETALTAREKGLLAKVENRNLSTSEQISMALALLAPALVGGLLAGKRGLAGGLAEGGKNVVGQLAGRQAEIKEAEELLPQLALEKSQIAKEKLATTQQANELKRKINESIPNFALRQLFNRDGMVLNGKLVLNTGNPLLPLKSTAVRTEKDYDTFREKTMPQLSEKVAVTEQGFHLLYNLQQLLDYSEKEKQGLQHEIPLYSPLSNVVKAFIPATRDTFIDEDGNVVKISELYDTTLEQLSDMYSQAIGTSGTKAAFKTYREHFKEMIPNPYNLSALPKGKTQPGTIKSQIKSVKDKFEDNIIKRLDSAGVETSPVKQLFSQTKINTTRSEANRKKQRANAAVQQVLGK